MDCLLSNSKAYLAHSLSTELNFEQCIGKLAAIPSGDVPELFGLHSNALISQATAEGEKLCNGLLTTLGLHKGLSGPHASDRALVTAVAGKLPTLQLSKGKYGAPGSSFCLAGPLRNLLFQEQQRYEQLLSSVRTSLAILLDAHDGVLVMDEHLE